MTNEEKAKEIGRKWYNDDAPLVAYRSALQMAKWKEEQMIKKASEWLEYNLCYYDENYRGIDSGNSLIEDFKKAMKGE